MTTWLKKLNRAEIPCLGLNQSGPARSWMETRRAFFWKNKLN